VHDYFTGLARVAGITRTDLDKVVGVTGGGSNSIGDDDGSWSSHTQREGEGGYSPFIPILPLLGVVCDANESSSSGTFDANENGIRHATVTPSPPPPPPPSRRKCALGTVDATKLLEEEQRSVDQVIARLRSMYPPPPPSSSAPFEGRPPPSETEGNTGGAPRLFTHAQAELRLIARHVAEVRSLLLTPPPPSLPILGYLNFIRSPLDWMIDDRFRLDWMIDDFFRLDRTVLMIDCFRLDWAVCRYEGRSQITSRTTHLYLGSGALLHMYIFIFQDMASVCLFTYNSSK